MYYLETSSLRKLAGYLQEERLIKKSFTSALSIIELISGMNPEKYNLRRTVLKKIHDSKLGIVLDLPKYIILSAFPAIEIGNQIEEEDELKQVWEIIIETENIEDVNKRCKEKGILSNLDTIRNYDETLSNFFRVGSDVSMKNFREQFSHKQSKALHDFLGQAFKDKEGKALLKVFRMQSSLYIMAYNLAVNLPGKNLYEKAMAVYQSYTGGIDYFIEALSYYAEKRMMDNQFPEKNDIFDLTHFLYLRNKPVIKLVSDDNLIQELCSKLGPRRGLKTEDIILRIKRR